MVNKGNGKAYSEAPKEERNMTHTYTYAVLEVSYSTFAEIRNKLEEAGYQHAIISEKEVGKTFILIDMNGIALKEEHG